MLGEVAMALFGFKVFVHLFTSLQVKREIKHFEILLHLQFKFRAVLLFKKREPLF